MAEGLVLFSREKSDKHSCTSDEDSDDAWDDSVLIKAYDEAVSIAKAEVARRMGIQKDSGNESDKDTNKKKHDTKKEEGQKEWHVGKPCCAVYSEDGIMYEATITRLYPDKGTCTVTFVGYENQEEVPIQELQQTRGKAARKKQRLMANKDQEETLHESMPVPNGLNMECSDGDSVKHSPHAGSGTSKQSRSSVPKSPRGNRMDWEAQGNYPHFFHPNLRNFQIPPVGMSSMGIPPFEIPPPPPPHLINSFPQDEEEALSAMLLSWYMTGFHTGYYQGFKHAQSSVNTSDSNNPAGSK